MAEIKPFAALRYDISRAGDISSLTCPPYDVITEEEQIALLKKSPYNAVRLELPCGEEPYVAASKTLEDWITRGILRTDMDEGIYICEDEFTGSDGCVKKRRGIICRVKLEEPESKIVIPHENTIAVDIDDRFALISATKCNFSPIFALYSDRTKITKNRVDLLSKTCAPRYNFFDGEVSHKMWVINDQIAINAIREDFTDRKLFIADGHHRYETALRYRDKLRGEGEYCPAAEYVMMYLTDMENEGLAIYPTHRLIKTCQNFDSAEILVSCADDFEISDVESDSELKEVLSKYYSESRRAFGFYDGFVRKVLVLKDNIALSDSENSDVAVLHKKILDKNNVCAENISYTRDFTEAVKSVENGDNLCCFVLNPPKMTEIAEIAAAGGRMPQKSTYFYPKLATGLVINKLD